MSEEFSFLEYLTQQPPARLDALYESQWTCMATFRALPPLAKHYVMRLLFVDSVPLGALRACVNADGTARHEESMKRMRKLRILKVERAAANVDATARLHPSFQRQLSAYLRSSASAIPPKLPPYLQELAPGPADLVAYARTAWEDLLLFLVGSLGPPEPMNGSTVDITALMQSAGLMHPADVETQGITLSGFKYLLLHRPAQLWKLLKEYITAAESQGAEGVAVVSFLLRLGFLTQGAAYPLAELPAAEQAVARDMQLFGLLYFVGDGAEQWFFSTPLAATATAELVDRDGGGGGESHGYIIVETNFHLYAYTDSPLELSILKLFVRPEYRLPNLFVGTITRESVLRALEAGLDVEQIVTYLRQHAHPHVARKVPVVPETVSDQIRLWGRAANRVQATTATLYDCFDTKEAFQEAMAFAESIGARALWSDAVKMAFIVRADAHPRMREFFREQKAKGGRQ